MERIEWRHASDEIIDEMTAFSNRWREESRPGDPPLTAEYMRQAARTMPSNAHSIFHIVRDPARHIIATAEFEFEVAEENQHLGDGGVTVLKEHRGRGIGKQLLAKLLEEADLAKRSRIIGWTTELVPAGQAFAERVGAEPGLREHTNRLMLSEVDRDLIAGWIDEGPSRAPGYSLVWNEGPYGELAERMVPLIELMNTAPREDLDIEDFKVTMPEMQEREAQMVAVKTERWSVIVRHDAKDEFVGFSEIGYSQIQPQTAYQWGTAVDPKHRGHALGKWMKAAMIDKILKQRPDTIDIRTGNADSNDAMLGINTQLGFKPWRANIIWQTTADQIRNYLGA